MEKLLTLAAEYDMLPEGALILCALSGGADSLCMTHFLWEHREKGGYRIAAAHYNHHLRGEASDSDQTFVADFCATLGIPLTLGGGDVAACKGNTEEAARQMRYAFLEETAKQLGAQRIATAHNADDNLESLLLNLTRGCGLQGLSGIPPRRGIIVRPLLTTSRTEIIAYLEKHQLPHVEDATNADDAYARNRIRHQVVPVLRSLNPQLTAAAGRALSSLRQDNDFIEARSARLVADAVVDRGDVLFSAAALARAPAAVAARCVIRLVSKAGGGPCSSAHISAVLALAREGKNRAVSLPKGITVRRDYEFLRFSARPAPLPFAPVPLHPGENPLPGTEFTVFLEGSAAGLVARPRQRGDRLTLPKVGTKSVKDWMADKKIPLGDRPLLPVVADQDGVLALCGFGMNPGHPRASTVTLTFLRANAPRDEKDG
ncbi:MAG: tRNA lysidine(34) synthetase TilS [Oscillospiraceae bacterium]